MKNKIAIASAFLAAASFSQAEIVINDFLSFEGFVDMSYVTGESKLSGDKASNDSYAIDQVEIDWLFDFDPVTAQIDLQYDDGSDTQFDRVENSNDGDNDVYVEQAFVTYHFDGDMEGLAFTGGRYASMLGFEAFEPVGLYQYSLAYDSYMIGDFGFLPSYSQGVKLTWESDDMFFGASVQDQSFNYDADRLGGSGESSWAAEVAASYRLADGITFFLGGAYEKGDNGKNTNVSSGDTYVINSYVTYETGLWLFAAEVNFGNSTDGTWIDGTGSTDTNVYSGLLMANYAYSDVASVTGRFSLSNADDDKSNDEDFNLRKYTVAHNYAFTDNLLLVAEISYLDGEGEGSKSYDETYGAVELLFSF
jgi:hypothetical protein